MAYFKLDVVDSLPVYQNSRTSALPNIKKKPLKFFFSEKHTFKLPAKKVLPIFVFEDGNIEPKIIEAIKKNAGGNTAEGTCYKNDKNVLVFLVAKGKLTGFSMVTPFQLGEALAQNNQADDNKIDIDKSKLAEYKDMVSRQEKKLITMSNRKGEIPKLLLEAKETLKKLTDQNNESIRLKQGNLKVKDKSFLAAFESANSAVKEILAEQTTLETAIPKLQKLIIAIKNAKTDQEKVDILFKKGEFEKPLQELEGTAYKAMMATNEALMVLGRTEDTWALNMSQEEQPRALSVEPSLYSLPANDAFMKGGIDIKARFQLVTPFSEQTIQFLKSNPKSHQLVEYVNKVQDKEPALWSKASKAPAVSCREVGQLLDDGYWFGVYPSDPKNPKSPLVQMMFPKALKPTVHSELLKTFELIKAGKSPLKPVAK